MAESLIGPAPFAACCNINTVPCLDREFCDLRICSDKASCLRECKNIIKCAKNYPVLYGIRYSKHFDNII